MHQYMLDNYRASRRGDQSPPQPGLHDGQVVREIRDRHLLRRLLLSRPVHGRLHGALTRRLPGRPGAGKAAGRR